MYYNYFENFISAIAKSKDFDETSMIRITVLLNFVISSII